MVVLGPETAAPGPKVGEATIDYNYKDSDIQDVIKAHMCWYPKPNDILLDSRFEHCELCIRAIDY